MKWETTRVRSQYPSTTDICPTAGDGYLSGGAGSNLTGAGFNGL